MNIKNVFKIIFLCWTQIVQSSTLFADYKADYLPLVPGGTHTYRNSFRLHESVSTLVTKVKKTKRGNIYYRITKKSLAGNDFDRMLYNQVANYPGYGVFQKIGKGIYIIKIFQTHPLDHGSFSKPQKVLNEIIKTGDLTIFHSIRKRTKYSFEVMALETVKVPAGTFKNTLKIRVRARWDTGKIYTGHFWLAKGVGIVKWIRGTGRVEVLTKYSFPEFK